MEDSVTSMLNKWDYSGVDEVCFSDANCESYKKSAEFLGKDEPVEDWGCGTGWSKHYFTNYKGIDGSPSKIVAPENVVDLVHYTSSVDNILMRQTLECNVEWKSILDNVVKSFKKKFCLIIFTPFVEDTEIGCTESVIEADGKARVDEYINLIFFNKEDILSYFPEKEYKVSEETIITNQGYGSETIFYVERL